MKALSALTALGLILAVSGTAGALTVPIGPDGPSVGQVTDYSVATVYTGKVINDPLHPGTHDVFNPTLGYYDPVTGTNHLFVSPRYPTGMLELAPPTVAGKQAFVGESWGIFRVNTASVGHFDVANNGVSGPDLPPWFSSSAAAGEIVGMYTGRKDISVQFVADSNGFADATHGQQHFEFAGDKAYFYLQPIGSFDPNFGPGGRIGTTDKYRGIGFDKDGNALTDSILLGTFHSAVGFYGADPNTEGISDFNVASDVGSANLYYHMDPNSGDWWPWLDTNIFSTSPIAGPGKGFGDPADMKLRIDDTPTDTGSLYGSRWDITSNDPLQVAFNSPIPEPLTMVGVFLGIGGLTRYMRRRMAS